jgi:hypothetical protein
MTAAKILVGCHVENEQFRWRAGLHPAHVSFKQTLLIKSTWSAYEHKSPITPLTHYIKVGSINARDKHAY